MGSTLIVARGADPTDQFELKANEKQYEMFRGELLEAVNEVFEAYGLQPAHEVTTS